MPQPADYHSIMHADERWAWREYEDFEAEVAAAIRRNGPDGKDYEDEIRRILHAGGPRNDYQRAILGLPIDVPKRKPPHVTKAMVEAGYRHADDPYWADEIAAIRARGGPRTDWEAMITGIPLDREAIPDTDPEDGRPTWL